MRISPSAAAPTDSTAAAALIIISMTKGANLMSGKPKKHEKNLRLWLQILKANYESNMFQL